MSSFRTFITPSIRASIRSARTTSRITLTSRPLSTTRPSLLAAPVNNNRISPDQDPSVVKQYDAESPISEQVSDFYKLVDGNRISLLITNRSGHVVSRAMAVSKRVGPDFYYLANINSAKISDIQNEPNVNISFFNTSDKSWVSVSGVATISQDDPKIREFYSPVVSAWFGDLGDGVHSGNADDPRMALVTVTTKRVSYYLSTKGKIARMADMAKAISMGQVAQTGLLRELSGDVLEGARAGDGH